MEKMTLTLKEYQPFQHGIISLRGQYVIIDYDLAQYYGVPTKVLNQAVKRNFKRFPERFRFELTDVELVEVVTNCDHLSSLKYSPVSHYAFTEEGVAQLSSVLKSDKAVEISIKIMDAFVAMRKMLFQSAWLSKRIDIIEERQHETEKLTKLAMDKINILMPPLPSEKLFPTGCVFDAWNYVSGLVRSAEKRVILIDKYVDERVLSLLNKRQANVSAEIYSRYDENFLVDLEKHNSQYPHIDFVQLPHRSHDRFLIIDDTVYLLGASVKDMGVGLCAITQMEVGAEEVLRAHRMHGKSNK